MEKSWNVHKTKGSARAYSVCVCGFWAYDGSATAVFCRGCGRGVSGKGGRGSAYCGQPVGHPKTTHLPQIDAAKNNAEQLLRARGHQLPAAAVGAAAAEAGVAMECEETVPQPEGQDPGCNIARGVNGGDRAGYVRRSDFIPAVHVDACHDYMQAFGQTFGVDLWSILEGPIKKAQADLEALPVPVSQKVLFEELAAAQRREAKAQQVFDKIEKSLARLRAEILEVESKHLQKLQELQIIKVEVQVIFEKCAHVRNTAAVGGETTPRSDEMDLETMGPDQLQEYLRSTNEKLIKANRVLQWRLGQVDKEGPEIPVSDERMPGDKEEKGAGQARRGRGRTRARSRSFSRSVDSRPSRSRSRGDDEKERETKDDAQPPSQSQEEMSQRSEVDRIEAAAAALQGKQCR
jgi:hypothetical protein